MVKGIYSEKTLIKMNSFFVDLKLKPLAETFDFKRKFIEQAQVLSGRKYAKVYLIKKA